MSPLLVYMPVLMLSPILLVFGIFFLVVPGGFILIVAGTVMLLQLLGAAAVAAVRQLLALRAKQRRGRATVPAMAPHTARAADAAAPVAAAGR
jgi:hypothetical protein